MSTSTTKTMAFFGATGGTAGASLAAALKAGYHCTALVRSPEKLRNFLINSNGIDASTIDQYLIIHQGDAKTPDDVKKALVSPTNGSVLVDTIMSAIGAYPTFQWSIMQPFVLTDPHVCEAGMAAIFSALDSLASQGITATQSGQKPFLVALSACGVNGKRRDVPWLILPLYHYLGSSPHADKRKMEELILNDDGVHIRDFTIIRPSFLTDGVESGLDNVRVGWEWGGIEGDGVAQGREKEPGPMLGWSISRKDAGAWVFGKVVKEGGWEEKCVTITY